MPGAAADAPELVGAVLVVLDLATGVDPALVGEGGQWLRTVRMSMKRRLPRRSRRGVSMRFHARRFFDGQPNCSLDVDAVRLAIGVGHSHSTGGARCLSQRR